MEPTSNRRTPNAVHKRLPIAVLAALALTACATRAPEGPTSLKEAQAPAWSVKARPGEMVVAVSPTGGILRWAGSTGTVLGLGVDAVVNDRYRQKIKDALDGYDTSRVLDERLRSRLGEAIGGKLREVAPFGSTAGMNSDREAQLLRYAKLGKEGVDLLLELVTTHGVFGYEGTLAVMLDAKVVRLPQGRAPYRKTLVVTTGPVLASNALGDPTKQKFLATSLELTVDESAMAEWTNDNGALFKQRFETAVEGAISALLCDLGQAEDPIGEFCLGKEDMNRKKFQEAEDHFAKAVRLEPDFTDARNARAVNLAHSGNVDGAIVMARDLVESKPDCGPASYNLAWWLATEKGDDAKPYYEKALQLGMPRSRKIEKALQIKSDS